MVDDQPGHHPALLAAAEQGDAQATLALATRAESRGRQLLADARAWQYRSMHAGSLDATHGLVRLHLADNDLELAQGCACGRAPLPRRGATMSGGRRT